MTPARTPACIGALVGALSALTATPAVAQTASAGSSRDRPVLAIFAGAGTAGERGVPIVSGGIRRYVRRHMVIEIEGAGWRQNTQVTSTEYYVNSAGHYAPITTTIASTLSGWSAGANVLFRTAEHRVTLFGGGGLLVARYNVSTIGTVGGCPPPPFQRPYCTNGPFDIAQGEVGTDVQAIGGVDVRIAGPVSAYALLEVGSATYRQEGLLFGVRVNVKNRD